MNKESKSISILNSMFKSRLLRTILFFLLITLIASTLVLYFEQQQSNDSYGNLWDSVWWAIVTIFTVGYGDKTPVTIGGRIIAIVVMFFGIYLVSLFTASISSMFITRKLREGKGLETVKLENHLVVCGWMNNAESIIETLLNLSDGTAQVVLVNELPEDQITAILDKFGKDSVRFVHGDYTRHAPLERANIQEASAVLLLPNLINLEPKAADEKTLLATLNIKSTLSKLKVIAFIMLQDNYIHIKRAKADEIFISDQYTEFILASDVLMPGMKQIVSELFKTNLTKNSLQIINFPQRFIGKPYVELFTYFKENKQHLTIGLIAEHESANITDFLSSDSSHLDAFIEKKLKESGRTLGEENKIFVNLNPEDDYIIRENEKAVVLL